MLENPTDSSSAANITAFKRYAPPNQRQRSLGRRKSGGDPLEQINKKYAFDGEKVQVATSRNAASISNHVNAVGSNLVNQKPHPGLIPLHGCCKSEAFHLLNYRWAAVINAFNDPMIDLAERPVMYSGSGASAWGHFALPHQLMSPTVAAGPSGSQMDFLSELRCAIYNANARSDA